MGIESSERSRRNPSFSEGREIMTVIEHKNDETREYHIKKLYELSLKSLGEIPQLDEPTDEQSLWVNRRMRASTKSWDNSHV